MLSEDAHITVTSLYAAMNDSEVPLTEHMRKEFFYKCYMSFHEAVGANPALIADEVRK